ncbi:MAG: hypothetical protein U0636_00810 [Phycisphaerales bacterium]
MQYKDEPNLVMDPEEQPKAWLASNFLGASAMEQAGVAYRRGDGAAARDLLMSAESLLLQAVVTSDPRMSPLASTSPRFAACKADFLMRWRC